MAVNQRYGPEANHIYVPDLDTTSGAPVVVGAIAGVAKIDTDHRGGATVWLVGSYDLEVQGTAGFGDVVYMNGSGNLTTTAGNEPFGVSLGSKGGGAGTLEVAPFGYRTPVAAPSGD